MRWSCARVTTSRSWFMSLTVRVLGTSTSMPDWRMGAVIMKMMSRTSTTSTKGTMLISESEVCVDLESCGIFHDSSKAAGWGGREILVKCLFDLGCEFQSKSVEALGEVANLLQKMIIEDDGGNRSGQTSRRGPQGFRHARSNNP